MWIIVIIILLLIWGNLSKKSASHPLNSTVINTQFGTGGGCCGSTAGDCMTMGSTVSAGVPEPLPQAVTSTVIGPPSMKGFAPAPKKIGAPIFENPMPPAMPIHVTYPVDPVPIAITSPRVPVAPAPKTGTPITRNSSCLTKCMGPTDCQAYAHLMGGGTCECNICLGSKGPLGGKKSFL